MKPMHRALMAALGLGRQREFLIQALTCLVLGPVAWPLAWSMGTPLCLLSIGLSGAAWREMWRRPGSRRRHGYAISMVMGALTALILACAVVILLRKVIVPRHARLIHWNLEHEVLVPGYSPACDVQSTMAEALERLRTGQIQFETDTPHWNVEHGVCDCSSPDSSAAGTCGSPKGGALMPNATVVHALVDLGRAGRSPCHYLNMFLPHLMRNVSMVVYTEEWAMPFVHAVRKQMGLEARTLVRLLQVRRPEEGGLFYRMLPAMQEVGNRNFLMLHHVGNAKAGKIVAKYAWVNHLKYELVSEVAKENPFQTGWFVWMDAGAGHGKVRLPQNLCVCATAVPNSVTVFHTRPNEEELYNVGLKDCREERFMNWGYWYRGEIEEVIGTYWLGDAAGVQLFWKDYHGLVQRLLSAGYSDHDQTMLAIIAASQPSYLRLRKGGFWKMREIC